MKRILALILAGAMVFALASCKKTPAEVDGSQPETGASSSSTEEGKETEDSPMLSAYKELAKGTKEHYDGIEMMILQDRSLAVPGGTAKMNVVITNKGDKKVVFVKGAGTNTVPDALTIKTLGLKAKHEGGISTADFQVEELNPGESKSYNIEFEIPESDLAKIVADKAKEDGVVIDEFTGSVPGLAIFQFTALEDENDQYDQTKDAKGYVVSDFYIAVAGDQAK